MGSALRGSSVPIMAFGIAGLSVVADSLSAIKYGQVKAIRDETGLVVDYETSGDYPLYGNNDNRADHLACWLVTTFMPSVRAARWIASIVWSSGMP